MAAQQDTITLSVAELEADPHGVFRKYRPITPLLAREGAGSLVIRAPDVQTLMRDPRLRQSETEYPEMRGIPEGAILDAFKNGMLTSNGAVHRRRRAPFSRTFAARLIADLRPHIRRIADELIDDWYQEGEVDFIDRYAALVPARTISHLLGLPAEDIPHFTALVYRVTRVLSFMFAPEELPEMEAATQELMDYVERLLQARRDAPVHDFLSSYVADTDPKEAGQKDELSPMEVIVQILTLIVGGSDTTRVAMCAQVALLLQHHAQWDAVCRDPSLIPKAVSEALRFEPSVASAGRVTLEDIELDGQVLPAGQFVDLSIMSALRDPAAYATPDSFDISRADLSRQHLVFGGGAHRCLGEALAWTELEESLAALTSRLPGLRLAGAPPQIQGHFGIRRIDQMRVAWRV